MATTTKHKGHQLRPQFLTDEKGKKISVLLSIKEFERIIGELEELEDIRMYDEAKSKKQEFIPIDQAFSTIESKRKKKK